MARQQPERRFTLLYDKVYRQDILQEAWRRVKSNKGAARVDEVDIEEIREYGEARFLGEIEQALRNGSYRVSLVRRVHIPKSGQPGKTRPLGIPNDEGPSGTDGRESKLSPGKAGGFKF